jgi:hypothetical protein
MLYRRVESATLFFNSLCTSNCVMCDFLLDFAGMSTYWLFDDMCTSYRKARSFSQGHCVSCYMILQ